MKSVTPTYHHLPHDAACCPPSWVKRATTHFRPVCIAATVAVSLWAIVHCVIENHPLPDGITGLILVILGVNAGHSAATGIADSITGKKAATAAEAALNANPAGIAGK
jgi:hypothetical protein